MKIVERQSKADAVEHVQGQGRRGGEESCLKRVGVRELREHGL